MALLSTLALGTYQRICYSPNTLKSTHYPESYYCAQLEGRSGFISDTCATPSQTQMIKSMLLIDKNTNIEISSPRELIYAKVLVMVEGLGIVCAARVASTMYPMRKTHFEGDFKKSKITQRRYTAIGGISPPCASRVLVDKLVRSSSPYLRKDESPISLRWRATSFDICQAELSGFFLNAKKVV